MSLSRELCRAIDLETIVSLSFVIRRSAATKDSNGPGASGIAARWSKRLLSKLLLLLEATREGMT